MTKAVLPRKSKKPQSPKSNPLRKASRPTLVRWVHMLESLRTDTPPNGYKGELFEWRPNETQFAKAFECSVRTINRDVQALRQCGYKLDYEGPEHTLYWTNKRAVETLPLMAATEDEVISLITALAISHSVLDSETAGNIRSFVDKLEQHLDSGFVHQFEDIQRTIQYKHVYETAEDTTLWTRIQRVILDQRGIEVVYASPHEGNEPVTRQYLPLLLENLEGFWYVQALPLHPDGLSKGDDFRLLRLNRIQSLKIIKFQVPEDWNREAVLKRMERGIGAWQGGSEEKVRLRISASKIGFMRERAWYPGHRFTQLKDGDWELAFKASQVDHLVPFVMSWGPDIEVLEPEHLRDEVYWAAKSTSQKHKEKD